MAVSDFALTAVFVIQSDESINGNQELAASVAGFRKCRLLRVC